MQGERIQHFMLVITSSACIAAVVTDHILKSNSSANPFFRVASQMVASICNSSKRPTRKWQEYVREEITI